MFSDVHLVMRKISFLWLQLFDIYQLLKKTFLKSGRCQNAILGFHLRY